MYRALPALALLASTVLVLACSGSTPLPEQRLCDPGQSTTAWMERELPRHTDARALVESIPLRAPTVVCEAGSETRGQLLGFEVFELQMEGGAVASRELQFTVGDIPKFGPKLFHVSADLEQATPPVRIDVVLWRD